MTASIFFITIINACFQIACAMLILGLRFECIVLQARLKLLFLIWQKYRNDVALRLIQKKIHCFIPVNFFGMIFFTYMNRVFRRGNLQQILLKWVIDIVIVFATLVILSIYVMISVSDSCEV